MAGISHIGIAFGLKRMISTMPIWLLLIASEALEILWMIFFVFGIENMKSSPWSHSLFMSAIWAIVFGTIVSIAYRKITNGIIISLIVFSHWIIDFITHPMGAIFGNPGQPKDIPLFFGDTPKVGLGLYNNSIIFSWSLEIIITAIGVMMFITLIKKKKMNE
jgi:hypothetical protein